MSTSQRRSKREASIVASFAIAENEDLASLPKVPKSSSKKGSSKKGSGKKSSTKAAATTASSSDDAAAPAKRRGRPPKSANGASAATPKKKKAAAKRSKKAATATPATEEDDAANEFTVEAILEEKLERGKPKYLVKWEGYPVSGSTWEPRSNLEISVGAEKVLLDWIAAKKDKDDATESENESGDGDGKKAAPKAKAATGRFFAPKGKAVAKVATTTTTATTARGRRAEAKAAKANGDNGSGDDDVDDTPPTAATNGNGKDDSDKDAKDDAVEEKKAPAKKRVAPKRKAEAPKKAAAAASPNGPWQPPFDVASAPLHAAELEDVADILDTTLNAAFKEVNVSVVKCPDLTTWGLAASGLSGNISLVDIGGVPNLMNPQYHGVKFDTADIAKAIKLPGASFLGAGAAVPAAVGGVNAELVACHHLGNKTNNSQYAKVGKKGEPIVDKYDSDHVGLLCNLLASQGKQGKVIEVRAKIRTGTDNFVTTMRKGLTAEIGKKLDGHIGLGGVFRITHGKIKAHIMPDFKKTTMEDGTPEVDQWLKFYTMGPNLTCASTFLTGDPTVPDPNIKDGPETIIYHYGNIPSDDDKDDAPAKKKSKTDDKKASPSSLNLRLEHTHFWNDDLKKQEAGHYHTDITPHEVEYHGYFVVAAQVWRLGNAAHRSLCPSEFYENASSIE